MRPDQLQRLADVSERLAETVIVDADPDNWTATGMLLADMTQEQRGDAAWCRKTAVQSVALLIRVEQLLDPIKLQSPNQPDPEAEIKRAERAASEMLIRVSKHESVNR